MLTQTKNKKLLASIVSATLLANFMIAGAAMAGTQDADIEVDNVTDVTFGGDGDLSQVATASSSSQTIDFLLPTITFADFSSQAAQGTLSMTLQDLDATVGGNYTEIGFDGVNVDTTGQTYTDAGTGAGLATVGTDHMGAGEMAAASNGSLSGTQNSGSQDTSSSFTIAADSTGVTGTDTHIMAEWTIQPALEVTIPAYTPVSEGGDNYTGTLTVTFATS